MDKKERGRGRGIDSEREITGEERDTGAQIRELLHAI